MTRPDRRLRGFLRRSVHGPIAVWYHPTFRLPLAGLESQLGIEPRRADDVLTWALDLGLIRPADVHEAPEASWASIRLVHDQAYLASLDRRETLAPILGVDVRTIPTESMLETWRRSVGATVEAAQWAVERRRPALALLGGFHHAYPDRGGGFCALNDVAVAVAVLRDQGFRGRVAILDLDAHPPDGTAACLSGDQRVHILSLSAESAWEQVEGIVDLRLPPGSEDEAYLAGVERLLDQLPDADLVFYLAGADPLRSDPFGGLACTRAGLRQRDRRVLAHLGAVPTAILPAGGYTNRAWHVFAGTLAEAAGSCLSVVPGYDPVLRRTIDIFRTLDPGSLTGEDEWISPEDLYSALGMSPPEERLLGFYTRQGVEYALSEYGLLSSLERMGFDAPRVVIQARNYPHLLRVVAEVDGQDEVLIDVSLSRRRVERWETLFVEWLELRDPRLPFAEGRPRLPGQTAPGLGLLAEVGHLLLRMAVRLDLAGLSFIPSYYHIAWIAKRQFVAVDPEARGRIRALTRHLAGVGLLEATHLLDGPGLQTEVGERARWEPPLMVYPGVAELEAHLAAGERRAEDVAETFQSLLIPLD